MSHRIQSAHTFIFGNVFRELANKNYNVVPSSQLIYKLTLRSSSILLKTPLTVLTTQKTQGGKFVSFKNFHITFQILILTCICSRSIYMKTTLHISEKTKDFKEIKLKVAARKTDEKVVLFSYTNFLRFRKICNQIVILFK